MRSSRESRVGGSRYATPSRPPHRPDISAARRRSGISTSRPSSPGCASRPSWYAAPRTPARPQARTGALPGSFPAAATRRSPTPVISPMSSTPTLSTGSWWAGSKRSATRADEGVASRVFPPRGETQAQRIEPDEALGVALVVDRVLLKGDVAEAVEALRRPPADNPGRSLVELEAHDPLDILLALVDQRLEHLALGREPEAIVDQLGVTRHQLVLQMCCTAVEGQALDPAMRRLQDRAARRLVDTARFHADKAVLDEIEPADPVLAAALVQSGQQCRRGARLAVERDRVAALEGNLHILRCIGRRFRGDGAAEDEFLGFDPRILEHLALG